MQVFLIERVHVALKTLVQPKIFPVGRSYQIRPPLVAKLVQQQPVGAVRVELELIAIGDIGRVLHTEMRRFDDAYLLRAKWIWPEIFFVIGEIFFLLRDQFRRFVIILGQNVENDRQRVARDRFVCVLDPFVRSGVKDDRIVRDRICHPPVVGRCAVAIFLYALEFARAR